MSEYRKIVGACGWFLEREELPLIAHRIATHSAERIETMQATIEELEAESELGNHLAEQLVTAQATITELEAENLRLLGDHVRCPKCGEAYTLNNGRAAALKEKTNE